MDQKKIQVITSGSLPYLLYVPNENSTTLQYPLICFLHGYDEGAPMPIVQALTLHGPFAVSSSNKVQDFILIAPQMPERGDTWPYYTTNVYSIIKHIEEVYSVDKKRRYLTGFSFGGNGVFDLAIQNKNFWAALWPVDPTRVPKENVGCPIWFSSGEVSRYYKNAFVKVLNLKPLNDYPFSLDRVYVDDNKDHVGTARAAYKNDIIYNWLLSKVLS